MTEIAGLLAINFAGLLAVILLLWLFAVTIRDVSFIDAFWAFGMVLLAWGSAAQAGIEGAHARLLLGLTSLWGLRLAIHLARRWVREGEDPRYARILARTMETRGWSWARASLLTVFLTQAPLLFITCLPAQVGIWAGGGVGVGLGILGWVGAVAALTGIAFESIGDAQLHAFRRNPANKGRVLDTGLWRYTRHPNYFGDALSWWGIWIVVLDIGWQPALASLIGPVFLTFTLTKWSGKALLEKGLHKTRPDYAAYVARTSGFVPWPPKTKA